MKKLIAVGLICMAASAARADLIISQYYEGASNDKWIEIFNTGASSVDLTASAIRLGLWSNANRELWKSGTAPSASITLSGTLAANSTYLIRNSSAALPAYATADVSSGSLTFNGDDSVVLYSGSTYAFANVLDAFGLTASTAADTSFVRNSSVLTGVNTDFNASDWTQYAVADVNTANSTSRDLDIHVVVPEPSTAALFGLAALLLYRRCRAA